MAGLSDIGSMAQSLQSSIDAAVKRLQEQKATQQTASSGNVEEYQQDVRKSSLNAAMFATNVGTLTKDTSRLNVLSSLAANDPADFYKFNVTTKGEAGIGRVGDADVRIQLMNRQGTIVADSSKSSGSAYDAYAKMEKGELTLDRGEYTLRISRDKGASAKDAKNYGVQLSMGEFTKDYDTIAKQPAKGDDPFANAPQLQSLSSLLTGNSSATSSRLSLLLGDSSSYGGRGSLLNGLF